MKGLPITTIASAIFVALIAIVHQSAGLTVDETCKIVQNNSYIADPADCQGWVLCLNGKPEYGKCGTGLLYDSPRGICDYASDVTCNTNVTTMCTGLTNVYKSNPFNCYEYCYCKNGESGCLVCPNGQVYDSKINQCVYDTTGSICSASSVCVLAQNGFIKNPNNCNGWYRCGQGQVVDEGVCSGTTLYNPYTASCDYASNVECTSSPSTPGATPGATPDSDIPKPDATTCSSYTSTNTFVSDGVYCNGYFACTSETDDKPLHGFCPENSNFNPDTQQCNDPNAVACLLNRCRGSKKSFMTAPNSGCMKYVYCQNGKQGEPTNCPPDFPYFNEVTGYCEVKDPGYTICKPTTAT